MTRLRKAVVLGAMVGALGFVLRLTDVGTRLEEDTGLGWLFSLRGPVSPPRDVVVVSIDRASAQQGDFDTESWPLPRHVHASVIRALASRDVSAIVMDVLFDTHRSPADDDDLARALAQSGKVVLAQSVNRIRLPDADLEIDQLTNPIDELQQRALALAPFPLPDDSQVHFFWPFFMTSAGELPTLPAVALQIHALPALDRLVATIEEAGALEAGEAPRLVSSAADSRRLMTTLRRNLGGNRDAARRALTLLDRDGGDLPVRDRRALAAVVTLYAGNGARYLNFYGPPGTIETIPFHALLSQPNRFDLAGKAVFVGEGASAAVTSAEQADTYRTVYSTSSGVDITGTEIGATAFANLLYGDSLRPLRPWGLLGLLLTFGIAAGVLARLLPGRSAVGILALLGAAYGGAAVLLFARQSLLVPLTIPLLVQLPAALILGLAARYRDIRKQVPVEIDPYAGQQVFEGISMTTDVSGYTALSERMGPGELAALLDEYYDMIRRLVETRGGMIWGRGGDSALCVWKGPSTRGRFRRMAHKERLATSTRLNACLAAIEIRDAIDRFNAGRPETHQLPTRIGLDAGEIGLGPVGGELQAVGSPASLASRIQQLNKDLSTKLLASAAAVDGLEGLVLRRVGTFELPGASRPVSISEILGRDGTVSPTELSLCREFVAALDLVEKGQWSEAATRFRQIDHAHPGDGPTAHYSRLCERHLWDSRPGVV
jgi:adenylate cyclase